MSNNAQAFIINGFKHIHRYSPDGREIVDICEPGTGKLVGRKERGKTMVGGDSAWEWTYGAPNDDSTGVEALSISKDKNPFFFRADSPTHWVYRVRNLPYGPEYYNITVDTKANQIVIRTTNKKYFKRINAPTNEIFVQSKVEWNWAYNTLVIQHPKPDRVIAQDKKDEEWRRNLPVEKDGDECQTQ